MQTGFIRTLMADQDELNACAIDGTELPDGTIIEGLTDGGTVEGIRLYWIGDTPKTAKDPDQTLILLMVNEETNQVSAFRTSVNMLAKNEPLISVSMFLYRDAKSDRMEQEKYNVFWFDSAPNEPSLVKVITNVLNGRTLEMPRPLRIPLCAYTLEGTDWPVYSLTDHLFVLADGTKGSISLFDGFYQATFDGDVFESDYLRVEGIRSGDIVVFVKNGQLVWLLKTGPDTAEDFDGKVYQLVNNEWVELHEETNTQANNNPSNAA